MKRLFLHSLLVAICFSCGTTPLLAQSQTGSRFYEIDCASLDSQALELIKKHVLHMEEIHAPDTELLPMMSALAILLRNTPDRKQSIELFKKCLAIREKIGDRKSDEYKNELAGYAEAALKQGDPSTAEDMISKLIPLAAEYDVKHKLKFDLVECYTGEKNYARAEHLMLDTIKQNEAVGQCFSTELLGVADWYGDQKRYDEAKPWYLKAIAKSKQEGDAQGIRKAERAMSKFFVKENRPTDVTTLLKKSPPQIALNDTGAQFDLGDEGGVHYKYVPADTKAAEGKAQPDTVEEWMKEYREALKQLKQKHYLQAEFQFKSGTQKYKSHAEEVMFAIGLAKTYQEMKDQQKLRDAIAAMVKSQENGIGLPTYRPANQPPTMKKTAKESKPI